jgi:hypothetical protein
MRPLPPELQPIVAPKTLDDGWDPHWSVRVGVHIPDWLGPDPSKMDCLEPPLILPVCVMAQMRGGRPRTIRLDESYEVAA